MQRVELTVPHGTRFEFWVRGHGGADEPSLVVRSGNRAALRVDHPAATTHFVEYTHLDIDALVIEWNPTAVELPFAYFYDPATVSRDGITLLDFVADGIAVLDAAAIRERLAAEPDRPQLHFSPPKGWLNDPNGLCKLGETYHLFYQFHPAGVDWGPMHWGHAASLDLLHWTHLPVFLHPEQNLWVLGATGGAFSGTVYLDHDRGPLVFYTERQAAHDLYKDYREAQKLAVPAPGLVRPRSVQTILDRRPQGVRDDFRDPKVWKDPDGSFRMLLGAAIDDDPCVLLYTSPDIEDWGFHSVLYRAPPRFREHGARCVECPDFFPLGDRWVLIVGFVGYTDPETGRHNLLYAQTGSFDGASFLPDGGGLQELDFGTDFYAMQSFEADGRRLAFAWLFNWEVRKPPGSRYSGEMSLPRQITLDAAGRIAMFPTPEVDRQRVRALDVAELDDLGPLGREPIELALSGGLDGVSIILTSRDGRELSVRHDQGRLQIQCPEDDGAIAFCSEMVALGDLRLFFDRGILELFANGGALCGTRRSYIATDIASLSIQAVDGLIPSVQAWLHGSHFGEAGTG